VAFVATVWVLVTASYELVADVNKNAVEE
jgi:hypothetical protein